MKLHPDTQGCALSAIRLIEEPKTAIGDVVDVDDDLELCTVLSAAVWTSHIVISQLSRHTGFSRDAIIATLREEAISAFTHPNPEGDAAA